MIQKFAACLSLLMGLMLINGCRQYGDPGVPIPEDEKPAIVMLSPTNNNILAQQGTHVNFTFQLNDNEQLRVFRVVGRFFNQEDIAQGSDFIVQDSLISGISKVMSLDYLVPTGLPQFYKVRLYAYAIDTKGEYTKVAATINITFGPGLPPPYALEGPYNGARIYNFNAGNGKWNYRFSGGLNAAQCYSSVALNQDIKEMSAVGGGFSRQLSSPNNQIILEDSVFAVTDAARFNYDACTYTTIQQAFYTEATPDPVTKPLSAGDIVIVRLANNNPVKHYAVMKITGVYDNAGDANDYIEFNFKYSY